MACSAPAAPNDTGSPLTVAGRQERAVLAVLVANRHRVVGRRELTRAAGLEGLSDRRCDSVLVNVRRLLGAGSIVTVRARGWMLTSSAADAASVLLGQIPA